MGPRSSTPTRFRRSHKHPLFGKVPLPEWSKEGCRIFDTVDDLLRTIIGYVHGTGRGVLPHEFDGSRFVADPEHGTCYFGFRDPATGKRWAITNWKMLRHHRIQPDDFSEPDELPDESDLEFVVIAMCTIAGRRRLARMAKTNELDRLLAMRKVMTI